MGNISSPDLAPTNEELAKRVAQSLIEAGTWPDSDLGELIDRALSANPPDALAASRIFFRDVVERSCDLFDPRATAAYAALFARVVEQAMPGYSAAKLLERYQRIREIRNFHGEPPRVCVLSRITLGADVAVTSAMLEAAKQRFPAAEICFVGPAKNIALFEADTRIKAVPVGYARSAALRDRLAASASVAQIVDDSNTLVLDPDSRLTQLGMIPVCPEDNYVFFESRAYGGESDRPLSMLASDWIEKTLGIGGVQPYLKPLEPEATAEITVSLGVGENSEKRVNAELEFEALQKLVSLGRPILIDRGEGGEEARRVERLITALGTPANVALHDGSFASFAGHIRRSRLYFGYDSAGQHVAAVSGVPLVTIFAGYASERTYQRWRPAGPGPIQIVKVADKSELDVIERMLAAITSAAEVAGLS